ncbi:MAG TPA: IS481 family transposase, partial [Candidatus Limnocylindrales bacterium]|nr:IS481 family transposase [Candidatus Limnocylindrales bacterium]
MREMSVTEQRYKAVLAVIGDGRTVGEVAREGGISRRTMHRWLARYEGDGFEGLGDRSHRPAHCPHQMSPLVEAMVPEMRRAHPYWGARRIAFELGRKGIQPAPSESAVYRCLVRAAVIDPVTRRRRRETWKRWERAGPMELWQLDVVHGFLLADGSSAKALTGIDDHSRYCVSARLMARERTQSVCDGFSSALQAYGTPLQVLTDNGKVFTGRFAQPPVEVLFDRICRENGVDHILTQPRSPTTTGKIERFHRTLRVEFNTRQVFRNLKTAQEALDEWVTYYNTQRPHQALADATPETRFKATDGNLQRRMTPRPERNGEQWVCRRVASNGIVSVGYQQVSVGKHHAGSACDVLVTDGLLQFWVGSELLKTVARTSRG